MSWRQGQPYGQDLRDRVLAASGTAAAVAERFGVSAAYVSKARRRLRLLGEHCPGAQCNHMPRKLAGLEAALDAQLASCSHLTIEQLRAWAARQHGVAVSHATMFKALARLGLSRKKRLAQPPSSSAPT